MNTSRLIRWGAVPVAAVSVLSMSACVANTDDDDNDAIAVTSTDDSCDVATDTAASGTLAFDVQNDGSKVTEFYLLGDDELRIIGEVENIAPGTSRTLTFQAQPGDYLTVCKPGMIGDGVGQEPFTVTGDAVQVGDDEEAFVAAVTNYTAYVKSQTEQLVPAVQAFVDAYTAGDDQEAMALFAPTRRMYERIEPTAEQFGDLDPKIDYRKPGADAEGLEWTGFHRIEADLWQDEAARNYPDGSIAALTPAERSAVGDQLVGDIQALYDQVHSPDFALAIGDITNGAIGLLDEVAAPDGKLPGEEDEFSHTDLSDFYANVEGAQIAYENVRDIAASKGADGEELVATLDSQFTAMKDLLATYGSYDGGFVSYDTVAQAERNELGAQLNALSEPLSRLTSSVLGVG